MPPVEEICQATVTSDPTACIMRGELHQAINSFRRELSGYAKSAAELRAEVVSRLDQIISSKTEEARHMGMLEGQVAQLAADVKGLKDELASVRQDLQDAKEQPRDGALRVLWDVAKLLVAAGIGYFLSRGH